jgi:type III restriction enzyme
VVKKGKERRGLHPARAGQAGGPPNLVVINDEAHHAYRTPADVKISKAEAEAQGIDLDEATRWVEGLDRLHKTRRIAALLRPVGDAVCADRRTNTEAGLFSWVVSDFGLNDAIEAGLVKTPRVVVRDDACPMRRLCAQALPPVPRAEVADDLNREGRAARAAAQRWCSRPTPCWAPIGARHCRTGRRRAICRRR